MAKRKPCSRCGGSRWTKTGLCFSCDTAPILGLVSGGRLSMEGAHAFIDRLEGLPRCFEERKISPTDRRAIATQIDSDLEALSLELNQITRAPFQMWHDERIEEIKEEIRHLEAAHATLEERASA